MVAALDWQSVLVGAVGAIVAAIIVIGAVLTALGQIGRAWTWVMQRFRPAPPRVDLESSGGKSSHDRDEKTGEITWNFVQPAVKANADGRVTFGRCVFGAGQGVFGSARRFACE